MITTANRLQTVQEYYFSRKLKEVAQMVQEGKPVINLGIGSPDLAPDASIVDAIVESMTHEKAHQYQSYQGLLELRQGMKNFYEKWYGVTLNPATEILPLMGSKEGIMHISMAFLNAGDEVLIPNPGYPTYASVTNLVEGKAVFYDLLQDKNWEPDFEALEKLDLSKVKLMWVGYPHMPTGAKGTKSLFEKLVAFAKKHHIILVNDNPYSFVLNDNPQSILSVSGAKEVCLELNSLSKTFNMAGWRIGMVCGNEKFIEAILKVKSNMDSGMFYGIQKGAVKALDLPKEWFNNLNKVYENRRKLVFKLADKLGCTYDKKSVGLFVWAKLPDGYDSEDFIDKVLQDKHIFITPGVIFGSNGANYIRFSLCSNESQLEEAINRIKLSLDLKVAL
ncbi:pyridoxal phosphate-dependent aminotransferase [Flavobacterium haoranii]|uniref:Aminotransferase n=1 Tax=Flavobacterium haoranii TaxID=683124 RepID=A0A1M6DEB2_9FLAO|nr:aminotransferase class I/II-fold pyridoxal phosphate-dependent enzyme [Flavobacterium haoranii]SHI71510.1 Aspartate/methionine/tyrosine aminotransferase [Flavobacterium haoranii]